MMRFQRSRLTVTVVAILWLWWPIVANAQMMTDPRVVEFTPSALHSGRLPDGRLYVSRYDLEFYYPDAAEPFQVVNLGKPAPGPDGTIRATFVGRPFSWPVSGVVYVARVAAVGPVSVGRADASNPFVFSGRCSYVLRPATKAILSPGGPGTVSVETAPGCPWTASSSKGWAIVTTPSGTGPGIITYALLPSVMVASRVANISVADQTLAITQVGVGSSLSLPETAAEPQIR